jgi:hypothetical protein
MSFLQCTNWRCQTAALGQKPPPTFATAMEELARRPDANDVNCWHAGAPVGGRCITPVAVVPQRPAASAGGRGFGLGPHIPTSLLFRSDRWDGDSSIAVAGRADVIARWSNRPLHKHFA